MKIQNLMILCSLHMLTQLSAQTEMVTNIPAGSPDQLYAIEGIKHPSVFETQVPGTGAEGGFYDAPHAESVHMDSTEASASDPIVPDAMFMYPNPTTGIVQIKLVGKLSIQIYTISGQLIRKYTMAPGEKYLDLNDLTPGLYQVRAKSDEDYFSGKLLIQ